MTDIDKMNWNAVAQGGLGAIQGDNFFNGFASGGLGSLAGSGFQRFGGDFAKSIEGGTAFSALSGGVGAELSGGNFWRGAGQGATVTLLNHYMHDGAESLEEKWDRNRRAKAYAKQVFSGISLSEQNQDLSNQYYRSNGINAGLLSSEAIYNVINAEYVRQAEFNSSLFSDGSKTVSSLKVPKFIGRYIGSAMAVYEGRVAVKNYNTGRISLNELRRDIFSSGMSAIPIFRTGWSLGFEPGMKWGRSTWYGKNDYKWFE